MRSHAALGNHPLHPAMVAIPIGAFTVTLVGDIVTAAGGPPGWGETARYALIVGIVSALLAAVPGFVDYFTVEMSAAGARLATRHMILNLVAVVLFVVSLWLRHGDPRGWCVPGFAVSTLAFLLLGASGWIGGKMTFEHKIGVVENVDREATAIGQRESV
jgi:uncharacterized membrane protein